MYIHNECSFPLNTVRQRGNQKTRPKVALTKQKGVALTIYLYIYAVQYIEATDPLSLVQTFCLAKKVVQKTA